MKKDVASGIVFVLTGGLFCLLIFGGLIITGKIIMPLMVTMLNIDLVLVQLLFLLVFGGYVLVMCWLCGKYVVPRYYGKGW